MYSKISSNQSQQWAIKPGDDWWPKPVDPEHPRILGQLGLHGEFQTSLKAHLKTKQEEGRGEWRRERKKGGRKGRR